MSNWTLKTLVLLSPLAAFFSELSVAQAADREHLKDLSVPKLKALYLDCNDRAAATVLDIGTAAECSMIAEELLVRGFQGNFNELLGWWRSTKTSSKPRTDQQQQ